MTRTGDLKCREVKTGFCRKQTAQSRYFVSTLWQTGSSKTLIGWKSGKKHLFPSMGPNGGSVAMDSVIVFFDVESAI